MFHKFKKSSEYTTLPGGSGTVFLFFSFHCRCHIFPLFLQECICGVVLLDNAQATDVWEVEEWRKGCPSCAWLVDNNMVQGDYACSGGLGLKNPTLYQQCLSKVTQCEIESNRMGVF